jgi:RNA polymerase sigma-54 factor
MKPTQSLQLRQSQSLVMTQQLQQSIKLLQLSAQELNAFIEQEIEKNPLLGKEGDEGEALPNAENDSTEATANADATEALDSNYDQGYQQDAADGAGEEGSRLSGAEMRTQMRQNAGDANLEQYVSAEKSLAEHLHEQLSVDIADPQMRLIGSQLIGMLDENGYLRESVDELCELLGADATLVESTISALQACDPCGVFARNLQECLALQLAERNLLDPMMQGLIDNLQLLERGDMAGLQAACGADSEDFADMLQQIRSLNPYPARAFIHDAAQAVVPDVFVRKAPDGQGWQVELNAETLPNLLLNRHYYAELNTKTQRKEDKKYLSEQLSQASWLLKAIDQRAQTIIRVTSEIVKAQEAFFLHGIRFLKPLTLKDIALRVEMHESTISRVTTNKYMATPRGLFELKYFFTSSINAASGAEDVSSKTVMYYIRELIDAESPKKILSDDAIVTLLADRNIDIARRTVAKYREAMHIPSSVVRRRLKNAAFV